MNAQLTIRGKWLLAVALLIVAYIVLTPDESATTESAAANVSATAITAHARSPVTAHLKAHSLPPSAVSLAQRVTVNSEATQLFAVQSWYTPPPPPPAAPIPPPAAPTAPPLPYTALGSYLKQGGERVFFLTRGDSVYDVKVGDVLDGAYSVDGFENGQLLLTYKPMQIQQSLMVGGGS